VRKGLTKFQIICIVLLWVALCIMLFTLPSSASLGENIFVAILSGIIIAVAIGKDQQRRIRNNRRKLL
jgi:uncharacterized membrane-anchored protein